MATRSYSQLAGLYATYGTIPTSLTYLQLATVPQLAGSASGTSSVSGAVSGAASRVGTVSGTQSSVGSLSGTADRFGVVAGSSASSGSVIGAEGDLGLIVGNSQADGAASGHPSIFGAASGTHGSLGAVVGFEGDVGIIGGASIAIGAVSGVLNTVGTVAGSSASQGTATGTVRDDREGAVTGPPIVSAGTVTGTAHHIVDPGFYSPRTTSAAPIEVRRFGSVTGLTATRGRARGTLGHSGRSRAATETVSVIVGRCGYTGAANGAAAGHAAVSGRTWIRETDEIDMLVAAGLL